MFVVFLLDLFNKSDEAVKEGNTKGIQANQKVFTLGLKAIWKRKTSKTNSSLQRKGHLNPGGLLSVPYRVVRAEAPEDWVDRSTLKAAVLGRC